MQLERLTFRNRIVINVFGQHEVDNVFDVRDRDGRLCYIGSNNDLPFTLHEVSASKCSILLFLAERGVERYELDSLSKPAFFVKVFDEVHELEDFMVAWEEHKYTFLLVIRIVTKSILVLDELADYDGGYAHHPFLNTRPI